MWMLHLPAAASPLTTLGLSRGVAILGPSQAALDSERQKGTASPSGSSDVLKDVR